ncbi:glycosyltransferase family 2 protein [Patescibacteria group bacterium]
MKISIIIVTWNSEGRIKECLQSISRSDFADGFELIIIDNASSDNTVKLIQEEFPNALLTINKNNIGFAAGNNQGYAQATGDYVLMLNDDVILEKNTLTELSGYLDRNSSAAGVTCRFLNSDGSIQYGYHRQLPTVMRMLASGLHHFAKITTPSAKKFLMIKDKFDQEKIIEQAACTCLMLRRSVIDEIRGLLDENFPIFFNDVDLARRIINKQKNIYLVPTTDIVHLRGQSTTRLDPYWTKQEYYSSLFRYYKKFGQSGDYWASKISFIGLLWVIYGLTYIGLLKRYFTTPITDKKDSLRKQKAVIKVIIKNQPEIYPPQTLD